jgi:hypothetical protein
VWHIMNLDREGIGKHSFQFSVDSPLEGARLISALADVELKFPDRVLGSNVFGLEHFENDEWCEWTDDEFDSVDELVDSLEEQTS